jgi:hypothetical protein
VGLFSVGKDVSEDAMKMVQHFDSNRDGAIDLKEFQELYAKCAEAVRKHNRKKGGAKKASLGWLSAEGWLLQGDDDDALMIRVGIRPTVTHANDLEGKEVGQEGLPCGLRARSAGASCEG